MAGSIPKGLRHSAQRCHDGVGATLGGESQIEINPEGVEPNRGKTVMIFWTMTQGSRSLPRQSTATAGAPTVAGLMDGIPLGFLATKIPRLESW